MGNSFYFPWEISFMEWLQTNMGSFGETVAKVFSTIGDETITLLVLLIVMFCYSKEAGKRTGMRVMLISMWFPMIKNVALRVRPYMETERIQALQLAEKDADAMDIVQQGYSFPSGHAAMSVGVYGSIAIETRKRWAAFLAVIMPLLIGISRFAVGVHYPTDVLAGWALGILGLCFMRLLEKKVKKESVRSLIVLAVTLPGIFWCNSRDYFSALGILIALVIVFPYEKKYVNFQDTRNTWAMILRVAGAFAVYYVLNTLLKLPFSKEFLNNGTLGSNLIRSARYGIILFLAIGVYPRLFPLFEKVGAKKA